MIILVSITFVANVLMIVIVFRVITLPFLFLNHFYVCNHIPRDVLESTYGIMLPIPTDEVYPDRNPTAYELLTAYARKLNHFETFCLYCFLVFHWKEK